MIESAMIGYCAARGMVYDYYMVTNGGKIMFRAFKGKKEKWFVVMSWKPFKCVAA